MSSNHNGDSLHELLHYDPQHRVLICRECQYAIQKSAIESHLLRHKIYRGERRRILNAIAQLEILDPDHVQFPPPSSRPVAELPVLTGLKCVVPDCGMLCASAKRMKRHWAEVRHTNGQAEPLAEDVKMQTFFKGTKNRYFQVNAYSDTPRQVGASSGTSMVRLTSDSPDRVNAPLLTTSSPINMEQLQYFHHFSSATNLTLPPRQGTTSLERKTKLVQMALFHRDLMAGLLALSAFHLAATAIDEVSRRTHMENSRAFEQQIPTVESKSQLQEVDGEITDAPTILLRQLRSMLGLLAWSRSLRRADGSVPNQALAALQTFSSLFLSCQPSLVSQQHGNADLKSSQTVVVWEHPHEVPEPPPPVLRVHKLPYQIIGASRRLKERTDVDAIQLVANGLSECVSLSHIYADSAIVWSNLVSWLKLLTGHFLEMVRQKEVVALVALAFGAVMIKRVARSCWFLEGCAERWFALIVEEMSGDVSGVSGLVIGLLDDWPEDY